MFGSSKVPRDAVFNSRSQSRAMLDCGTQKRQSSFCDKKFPALYDQNSRAVSRRAPLFEYLFCTARFARRLFTQILQLSDLGG